MYQKIILAGGSGYLGQVLKEYFKTRASSIIILSRHQGPQEDQVRYLQWDGKQEGDWVKEMEGADLLVNLSGKNVNCRYNRENREEILSSRLEPTALLGKVISRLKHPPHTWINIVSATIYRHAEDRCQDEDCGEIGTGFSVDVCKAWESCFRAQLTPHTKKILLRTALVLGKKDGVFPRLKKMTQCLLGGKQGNGKQMVSWIYEKDFASLVEWCHLNGKDEEIYNASAPQAVSNEKLMQQLRKHVHMPFGFNSPAWLLAIGAWLIGTETELVLKSRWVGSKRLKEEGFRFEFGELEKALGEMRDER